MRASAAHLQNTGLGSVWSHTGTCGSDQCVWHATRLIAKLFITNTKHRIMMKSNQNQIMLLSLKRICILQLMITSKIYGMVTTKCKWISRCIHYKNIYYGLHGYVWDTLLDWSIFILNIIYSGVGVVWLGGWTPIWRMGASWRYDKPSIFRAY